MAHIRIFLLLLLTAVSLPHVRPKTIASEYFAASFTESYYSARPLAGQRDHPLCTCTAVLRTLDKRLGWVINLEKTFIIKERIYFYRYHSVVFSK